MSSRILTVFANSATKPLPTLQEEDDKINEILSKREINNDFLLSRDSAVTAEKLGRKLEMYKDELVIFHFSGHADRDQLFLEDKPARAQAVADSLANCKNLKLIILNGCSTYGQIKWLLKLENNPVIIATHAPVGDYTATRFSTYFYEEFCEMEKSIGESFESALRRTKLGSNRIFVFRGMGFPPEVSADQPIWAFFSKSEARLKWKIPFNEISNNGVAFVPNSILIKNLTESFRPYAKDDSELANLGDFSSDQDKIWAILQLPFLPISEHLRKLMAPEPKNSKHKYFDKLSAIRLNQIVQTYKAVIELVTFILLAELWNLRLTNTAFSISERDLVVLKKFVKLTVNEREKYCFPDFIELLRNLLAGEDLFVNELVDLPKFNRTSTTFGSAIQYLETLLKKYHDGSDENSIKNKCMKGEESLSIILSKLSFFIPYSMRSIKSIDCHYYRHSLEPEYNHTFVSLVQTYPKSLVELHELIDKYMYTASICLLREGCEDYLNLSPFIIDQNAFEPKCDAHLASIYHFEVFEKEMDCFYFKHVYQPEDRNLLETKTNKQAYSVIRQQFNAFTELFFNNSIEQL